MRKQNRWLRNVLSGVLIGIGCILPGASGGVMAVSFGLYRPMLDAVMGLRKQPGAKLRFLLPVGAGILGGIVLGAFGLAGAMARHERLMLYLFTGFILGGIPDLISEAEQRESFRLSWLGWMALGVGIALPLCLAGGQGDAVETLSPMQAFVTGLLEGVGTVVPGISTSVLLIRLGWYQAYLQAVSTLDAGRLALIAPGFALSALASMLLVKRLFDRHTGPACYAVLGFVLVSAALVFPGFRPGLTLWAELAMLVIGVVVVRWMGSLENKQEVRK